MLKRTILFRLWSRLNYLDAMVDAHEADLNIVKAHLGLLAPDCPPEAGKETEHANAHEPPTG